MKRSAKQKALEHEQEKKLGTKTKKAMRTLKDRDKVLYAPFSNIGSLNFEKSSGYITIPDSQVIYTRVADEEGNEGDGQEGGLARANVQGIDAEAELRKKKQSEEKGGEGNEGQKMVWHL